MAIQTVQVYYPSTSDKQFLKLCPCVGQLHRANFADNLQNADGESYLELTLTAGPDSFALGGIVVTFQYDDEDLPLVDGLPIEVVFPTPGCTAYTLGWPFCFEEEDGNGLHAFRVTLAPFDAEVPDASYYAYRNQAQTRVEYFYFDTAIAGEGTLHITLKAFGFGVFTGLMTGDTLQVNRADFAPGYQSGIFAKGTPFTVETEWVPAYGPSPAPMGLAISPVQRIL